MIYLDPCRLNFQTFLFPDFKWLQGVPLWSRWQTNIDRNLLSLLHSACVTGCPCESKRANLEERSQHPPELAGEMRHPPSSPGLSQGSERQGQRYPEGLCGDTKWTEEAHLCSTPAAGTWAGSCSCAAISFMWGLMSCVVNELQEPRQARGINVLRTTVADCWATSGH